MSLEVNPLHNPLHRFILETSSWHSNAFIFRMLNVKNIRDHLVLVFLFLPNAIQTFVIQQFFFLCLFHYVMQCSREFVNLQARVQLNTMCTDPLWGHMRPLHVHRNTFALHVLLVPPWPTLFYSVSWYSIWCCIPLFFQRYIWAYTRPVCALVHYYVMQSSSDSVIFVTCTTFTHQKSSKSYKCTYVWGHMFTSCGFIYCSFLWGKIHHNRKINYFN